MDLNKNNNMHLFLILGLSGLIIIYSSVLSAKQGIDTTEINELNQNQKVFSDNLDSMLNLWYVRNSPAVEDLVNDTVSLNASLTNIPDSVYYSRLSRIPSVISLTYNPIVRQYIEMYTYRKRDKVQVMLGYAEYYFPKFDEIFDYYGLPNELKYISIIESALNPRARSRTRAIGVWQFMYGTAKLYGLTMNSLVDDRRDPIKEAHAAARYTKDLYAIFGDWQLVVAAYNCGPGNVNKAIRRAGGKRDFWDIYRYLPRETRGYVPAFIAAVYTFNYYKEHNIIPIAVSMPLKTDTIIINRPLHLMQVSEMLKIPVGQLRDINPQYLNDIIPAKGASYPLALPVEYTSRFLELKDSIFTYKDSIYFRTKELSKSPNYSAFKNGSVKPSGNYKAIYYFVKSGETLGTLAIHFNCRINDLMDWNDLYGSRIRAGQRLIIYLPKNVAANYEQQTNVQQTNDSALKKSSNIDGSAKFIYYTVKQGDSLWEIAKRYPGTTFDDICRWNNLSSNTSLLPGQLLKIKVI